MPGTHDIVLVPQGQQVLEQTVFGNCLKQLILLMSLYITGADESRLDPSRQNKGTDEVVRRQLLTMTRAADFLMDLVNATAESPELLPSQVPTLPASASLRSAQQSEEHLQASQCTDHSCTSK